MKHYKTFRNFTLEIINITFTRVLFLLSSLVGIIIIRISNLRMTFIVTLGWTVIIVTISRAGIVNRGEALAKFLKIT